MNRMAALIPVGYSTTVPPAITELSPVLRCTLILIVTPSSPLRHLMPQNGNAPDGIVNHRRGHGESRTSPHLRIARMARRGNRKTDSVPLAQGADRPAQPVTLGVPLGTVIAVREHLRLHRPAVLPDEEPHPLARHPRQRRAVSGGNLPPGHDSPRGGRLKDSFSIFCSRSLRRSKRVAVVTLTSIMTAELRRSEGESCMTSQYAPAKRAPTTRLNRRE